MSTARITKHAIASVVIGSALAYLLYQTVRSSYAYYYSVDEFVQGPHAGLLNANPPNNTGPVLRLAGTIKQGTLVRNTAPSPQRLSRVGDQNMQLDFILTGQAASIPVRFVGTVPGNLTEGKEVVVEGRISQDKVLLAHKILTRCESKYRVKLTPPTDPKTQRAAHSDVIPDARNE